MIADNGYSIFKENFNSASASEAIELDISNVSFNKDNGAFNHGAICLMDKYHVVDYVYRWQSQTHLLYNSLNNNKILDIKHSRNTIPSDAYTLCFCDSNEDYDCTGIRHIQQSEVAN